MDESTTAVNSKPTTEVSRKKQKTGVKSGLAGNHGPSTCDAITKSEDWISKLPDDILVSILSLLTMNEALRTSVLSHRWRYLWTFTTVSLDFDGSNTLYELIYSPMILESERRRFIGWVNRVLKSHQGSSIEEFRVCFDLTNANYCKSDINSWINFALEKRVRRLELNFESYWRTSPSGNYSLTTKFLHNYCLDSLTALHLNFVDVTGEFLEYILCNCPFLEVLCVTSSESLVNLKFPGPLLKLRYLEISSCHHLNYMEISGVNLVSFQYCGPRINMFIRDVPCLVQASISGAYACFLVNNIFQFSSSLSQLEMLALDLEYQIFKRLPRFPKLLNLKQLDLSLDVRGIDSLLQFASPLKSSPMLQRFALKITGRDADRDRKLNVQKVNADRNRKFKFKCPHQCLKVFEMVGYVGCTADSEFASFILRNAASLEKIIIDPLSPYTDPSSSEVLWARTRARLLESMLPLGAELVIL